MRHLELIADGVVAAVKAHVAGAVSAIAKRIDELDARLKAIPAGARGDQGERGESIKGDKGEPGESIVGPRGEPGDQGESIRGEKGERGESGMPGESIRGEIGPQGLQGAAGEKGDPGAVGEVGATGEHGPAGPQGLLGERGADGAVGERGPPGESIVGEAGPSGKDGASIHPDTVALMVRDAVDKAVAALPPAKDGAPGRDAAELIVLPDIDEARSYPAGTYAKHAGGEIRAERLTDPVRDGDVLAAGWTVSREGIAGVVITQSEADPREIHVAAMLTDGTKAVATFSIPMVLDSGVWREGAYQHGDHVTWDGSGWIAQRATADKPGTSDAWRLSTKRGRDGRDGKDVTAHTPTSPVRIK